jgi:hypothetical protein
MGASQAERWALRELVDGRWIATHLPLEKHGQDATHKYRGCRNIRCRDEHSNRHNAWSRERTRLAALANPDSRNSTVKSNSAVQVIAVWPGMPGQRSADRAKRDRHVPGRGTG